MHIFGSSQPSWARILTIALAGAQTARAVTLDVEDSDSIKIAARQVATNMMSYYTGNRPGDNPGNLPDPYYWWEAGAMFNALIDYCDVRCGTKLPKPPSDKMGWLAMAQATFNTQAPRWDNSSCGGGLRWQIFTWNNGYSYKNTISTGGFFNLAARLAKYTGNSTYQDWAERAWDWTEDVGFMTPDYHFWDGASDLTNCTEVNEIEWTYNNGVFLLGAANMWNITSDPKWKNRVERIIESSEVFFSDNPKNVMFERACELVNTCMVDQRSFKGYLARWMAATTQLAPFTYDTIMPKLKASATAAAKACDGGPEGTTCGLKWTEQKWDTTTDFGQQMAALEVIQANLITKVAAPVTSDDGGTSKGDPSAGGKPPQPTPDALSYPITTGDRAGAGILTAMMMITVGGSAGWLVWD
ncbi:Six-hairpin glycosidase [Penicillium longicatenatum]|nr:Six-hairpin glycosidase [Penicillium longicatenatum]